MADNTRIIQTILTGEDRTEAAFRSAGANAKALQGQTETLGKAFRGLAGLFVVREAFNFLKAGSENAQKNVEQQVRLAHILKTSTGATKEQISALGEQAKALSQVGVVSAGTITAAQAQLATFDLQAETIQKLIPSVLDYVVAEKGMGASADETKAMVNGLAQALAGNFQSLTRTGFVLDEATKKQIEFGTESERAEALIRVLDGTYKDFNKTARENEAVKGMTQFKSTLENVKEFIFAGVKPSLELLINGLNQVGAAAVKSGAATAMSFGHAFNSVLAKGASIVDHLVYRPLTAKGMDTDGNADPFKQIQKDWADINAMLDEQVRKANETFANLGEDPGGGGGGGPTNYSDDAKKAAEKIKDAFRTLSKNVVSSLRDQEKAVNDLRSSFQKLEQETDEAMRKSRSKYVDDVKQAARQAQERIDDIEKEIREEEQARSGGFRTRIERLREEKLKEQAIISKATGEVGDLQSALRQDELDQLYEKHQEEIIEIRRQADARKSELEREITERQSFVKSLTERIASKGFLDEGSRQAAQSFLGSIGEAPAQQQIIFNFNGDVAGDEGIREAVAGAIALLNRQAALRNIAGN